MKRSRFNKEQIIGILKEIEAGGVAEAWLAASRTGEWEKSETFATLLFETCEASLPPMQGLLAGMDRAVAQEACLMLLGKFLMKNKRLKTNAAEGNVDEIARHLRASVKICIGYAARRLARERSKEVAKLGPDVDASNIGGTVHPRLRDVVSFRSRSDILSRWRGLISACKSGCSRRKAKQSPR